MVEPMGIEPLTSAVRLQRSPSGATAPRLKGEGASQSGGRRWVQCGIFKRRVPTDLPSPNRNELALGSERGPLLLRFMIGTQARGFPPSRHVNHRKKKENFYEIGRAHV